MARPKLVVINHERSEQSRTSRDDRKFRLEVGKKRLIFYTVCFAAALCWMFFLGVLAGKGTALVSSKDVSVRAQLMRFLGLSKPDAPPAPRAAQTWEEPKKILDSLNYYQDLTRKEPSAEVPAPPLAEDESGRGRNDSAPSRQVSEKTAAVKPRAAVAPAPAPEPEKAPEPVPSGTVSPGEHFTLLVSSLQNPSNAQRLMAQLKAKGYDPRLETLDLNGTWNRVLVGSFQSREAALKFAAEFNRKEKMEGLVIRESN